MRKELGKWLMDIAKYIATAVLLTSFIADLGGNKVAVYTLSVVAVILSLSFGLYLVKDNTNTNDKSKRKG